jgi:hypothetical protein
MGPSSQGPEDDVVRARPARCSTTRPSGMTTPGYTRPGSWRSRRRARVPRTSRATDHMSVRPAPPDVTAVSVRSVTSAATPGTCNAATARLPTAHGGYPPTRRQLAGSPAPPDDGQPYRACLRGRCQVRPERRAEDAPLPDKRLVGSNTSAGRRPRTGRGSGLERSRADVTDVLLTET